MLQIGGVNERYHLDHDTDDEDQSLTEEEEEKIIIVHHNNNRDHNRARRNHLDYEDILVDEIDTRLSAREGSIGRSLNLMRPNNA